MLLFQKKKKNLKTRQKKRIIDTNNYNLNENWKYKNYDITENADSNWIKLE